MYQPIPIGIESFDMDSRRSREELINGFLEVGRDGKFKRVRRCPGFVEKIELGTGPIRAMESIGDSMYVVSGSKAYRVRETIGGSLISDEIGDLAGQTSPVRINSIGTDNPQVMFLSQGRAFLYKTIDASFTGPLPISPDRAVMSIGQRFYFNRPGSSEFFGSEILDGLTYDPLFFASAETNPDPIIYMVSSNTGIWLMGSKSCERWTLQSRPTGFPLSFVRGGNIERGVIAPYSVVEFEDNTVWLADDLTVRQMAGNGSKISTIAFEEEIEDYKFPEIAEGFLVDAPLHKVYYLTFPADGVTWGYDFHTGLWHKRASYELGRWRVSTSTLFRGEVFCGDYKTGQVYLLDQDIFNENGEVMPWVMQSAPTFGESTDIYVTELDAIMEVGNGSISNVTGGVAKTLPIEPKMMIEVSKDGGYTLLARPDIGLGRIGNKERITLSRSIGRIARQKEMVVRLTVTDSVPVSLYQMNADVEAGV